MRNYVKLKTEMMQYKEYIELGFIRWDMQDSVEFNQTGYDGFTLTKSITDNMFIQVFSCELKNPKLYIRKQDNVTCHIIDISSEAVRDLVLGMKVNYSEDNFTTAC